MSNLAENFESRAAETEAMLPSLNPDFLSMADVQQYVRMWEPSHILATFVLGDTLLECVVRAKYGGRHKLFISPMNWHPTLVKALVDEVGCLLPLDLSKVHKAWMKQPHGKETEGKTVKEWKFYCEQLIAKGNRS